MSLAMWGWGGMLSKISPSNVGMPPKQPEWYLSACSLSTKLNNLTVTYMGGREGERKDREYVYMCMHVLCVRACVYVHVYVRAGGSVHVCIHVLRVC